jgi:hypothetical protein
MKMKLNLTKKKIFTLVVLLFAWLILTVVYIYGASDLLIAQTNLGKEAFFVVNKTMNKVPYSNVNSDELVKGEKLQGMFTANDNYLGQVSIRFYNFGRINPDSVIFRIKEQGQSNWYYEGTYKTDQFQPDMLFPFGFPMINDSKGKTYVFEVESLNGLSEHSIGLSTVTPLGATLYQYPKKLLLSNPKTFINFFVNNKLKKIQINGQTLVAVGIYLNFIILSLLLIAFALNQLMKERIRTLFRINSSTIIATALIVLAISAMILYLKKPALSYSISTLGYFILVAGVIYAVVESRSSK